MSEKSLYTVAKKTLPEFIDEDAAVEHKIKLITEIRDIRSQLQEARDRGVTVGDRKAKGTPEYNSWRRKAKSCLTIKNAQVQIIDVNLNKGAYNARESVDRQNYETVCRQADIQVQGMEDAISMLKEYKESGAKVPQPVLAAYNCLVEALEAADDLEPNDDESN